jgi:hypothetical protein
MGTSGGIRDMRWMGADRLLAVAGAPTLITTNDFPHWQMADGDALGGIEIVPHGWGLAEAHVVFYDAAAGAGNLSLRLRNRALGFLESVASAYDTDETITTSTHPQNVPLPLVYADIAVTGRTFTIRLDRVAAGLADAIQIMGINWELVG